jgi:hypothetical protein
MAETGAEILFQDHRIGKIGYGKICMLNRAMQKQIIFA